MAGLVSPDLARAVRRAADGSAWKVREGALSRIERSTTFHAGIFADTMSFSAKPVVWDDIFWRILGHPPKRKVQSSRHWLMFSCPVPKRAQAALARGDDAAVARGLLDFAEAEIESVRSVDNVPPVRFPPDREDDFHTTRVVERIAKGRIADARRIAEGVVAGRVPSMFTHNTPAGSIFELTIKHLNDGTFEERT